MTPTPTASIENTTTSSSARTFSSQVATPPNEPASLLQGRRVSLNEGETSRRNEKVDLIQNAIAKTFPTAEISKETVISLVEYIENKPEIELARTATWTLPDATIRKTHQQVIIFFKQVFAVGGWNAVELAYNYTTNKPLALLRVKQQRDTPEQVFDDKTRKLAVNYFKNSLEWYWKFNNKTGLVQSLVNTSLGLLGPTNYETETGLVQPAYQGNANELIRNERYDYNDIVDIFQQALQGLCTLHESGVAHRDINLGNLLYIIDEQPSSCQSRIHVAITDYGFMVSKDCSKDWIASKCANIQLCPPDYVMNKKMTMLQHQRADMWAMGILLYQILTKKVPYWVNEYHDKLEQGASPEHLRQYLSYLGGSEPNFNRFCLWHAGLPSDDPLWKLVKGMLDLNPETRITARKAHEYMQEAFSQHESNEKRFDECKEGDAFSTAQFANTGLLPGQLVPDSDYGDQKQRDGDSPTL